MIRIAVCEDDPRQTEVILSQLKQYNETHSDIELCVRDFSGGDKLLESLDMGNTYDLYILDVLMPEKNGIETARELRIRDGDAPLIFLTSSSDFALEAFGVSAAQYILKPVRKDNLFPILDKLIAMIEKAEKNFILVTTNEYKVKLLFTAIVCVESLLHVLHFNLIDGRRLCSKTLRVSFDKNVEPLLSDERFIRTHNSYVVNMAYVEKLTANSFIMKDGIEVPITRLKYATVKGRYLEYLALRGNIIG